MAKRRANGSPSKAVAYIRVSTARQDLSLDAQRDAIERWATSTHVEVVAWHVDHGVRSTTPIEERPALCAALADLRAHEAGVLVVLRRDRIARDVVIAATIDKCAVEYGAVVRSTTGEGDGGGPTDVLVRTMIDAIAQYERALICARTRVALEVKRVRGERISGQPPYGWRVGADGVRLEVDEYEQATIARAREIRASGATLTRTIERLAREGRTARSGRPFALSAVHKILSTSGA